MERETIGIDGEFGRLDLPSPGGSGGVRLYAKVDEAWTEIPAPQVDMHAAMVADFLRAVAAGVEVPAGAVDAARSLAAVNAVYRSAASRRPVRIQVVAAPQPRWPGPCGFQRGKHCVLAAQLPFTFGSAVRRESGE